MHDGKMPLSRMDRRHFLRGSVLLASAALLNGAPTMAQQPQSAGAADPNLINDIVAGNRILAQQGVLDGFGHVSARHSREASRFLMSRSLAPELVTAADIMEYDLEGAAVDAKGRASYQERFIHAAIYKARPDVRAIVHNHSPSVIPFGVSSIPLRPIYHMAAFIGTSVPIFDIRKDSGMTDMLVSDANRAKGLVETLGQGTAVLMRGHGIAIVGSTIPIAVGRSIYIELNARLQREAIGLGGTVTYLDPQEAKKMMDAGENNGYERPWQLWKAKVTN
jgi:ribulose-5-phosphate 4-epimerase/fuculose-1-phosphate aldolase